ncbi:MAG: ATP-binding protein [Pseudomonadota bacterium]
MIINFSVENYLSHKEMVTLSLEASSSKELSDNVIFNAGGTGFNLLKSVVLYGANASGKSNLIKALSFMARFVILSTKNLSKRSSTGVTPFKLDANYLVKPSVFEISFISGGVRYLYGFSLDTRLIHGEWLYSYPYGRKRLLFERYLNENNKLEMPYDYKFGEHWSGEAKKIIKLTRPDSLFVTTAAQFNHPTADIVFSWFAKKFRIADSLPQGKSEEGFTIRLAENRKFKKQLLRFLQFADLGIADFELKKVPLSESRLFRSAFHDIDFPEDIMNDFAKSMEIKTDNLVSEIITYRKGSNENGKPIIVPFLFEEESQGTQKFFVLAGPLVYVFNHGCCLVSDELDIQLHPLLSRNIVQNFHDKSVNRENAQLIFATHDISLIENRELFRRDQIWFTQKDINGATSLFSAWDFKIRKEENVGRGYLSGRFGAIPIIENTIEKPELK